MATDNQNKDKLRLTPFKDVPFTEDTTQKIIEYPDGTWERRITKGGHETRQVFHSSGSYEENRADGSVVRFYANNHTEFVKGSVTISVDNNNDIKIRGNNRINVDGDAHVEVAKNASVAVNGMVDVVAPKGHMKLTAASLHFQTTTGNITFNSGKDVEVKAKERLATQSGKVTTINAAGDVHIAADKDVDINAIGTVFSKAAKDTMITAGNIASVKADNAAQIMGERATFVTGDGLIVIGSGQKGPDAAQFYPIGDKVKTHKSDSPLDALTPIDI